MVDHIRIVILCGLLLLCSIEDVQKKKVSLWSIMFGGVLILGCIIVKAPLPLLEHLAGCLVGVFVIILSKLTHGKIGMGDAFLLCITGLGLGFWGNLELFCFGLLFAAIISIFLLIFRIADRKMSIPFVPFLFAGYVVLLFASKGSMV